MWGGCTEELGDVRVLHETCFHSRVISQDEYRLLVFRTSRQGSMGRSDCGYPPL